MRLIFRSHSQPGQRQKYWRIEGRFCRQRLIPSRGRWKIWRIRLAEHRRGSRRWMRRSGGMRSNLQWLGRMLTRMSTGSSKMNHTSSSWRRRTLVSGVSLMILTALRSWRSVLTLRESERRSWKRTCRRSSHSWSRRRREILKCLRKGVSKRTESSLSLSQRSRCFKS